MSQCLVVCGFVFRYRRSMIQKLANSFAFSYANNEMIKVKKLIKRSVNEFRF